ncbi:methyl-accepting chemotaxis protein [Curvibacter sp. HBC61]|uniref:Methyl-accepting chemotaxis protein n=1 Tax=Curvibacter cyanobacteriorum TaxID=3026422 RepID=A0ABT5N1Z4_9BURK|nr:methyl-accepting chemotaxis protein [Curvibacter sp. HBC61]MDD0840319.1 methyl-accepting chemotaxis protein [Curvibacter sp. HBC61]
MFALNQLRIGTRLRLSYVLLLVLLTAVGWVGSLSLRAVNRATDELLHQAWVKAEAAQTITATTRANARRTMELFFVTDAAERTRIRGFIDQNKKTIAEAIEQLDRLVERPDAKALLARLKEARTGFVTSFSQVDQLLEAGQREAAEQKLKSETLPAIDALQGHVDALMVLQRNVAHESGQHIEDLNRQANTWLLLLGGLSLVIGGLASWLITRSILQPVQQAVQVSQQIAEGDLCVAIEAEGRDEAAHMLQAMARMQAALRDLVLSVRGGVDQVSSAASQIATANQDLSGRTESQASALQETAASMEQLGANVRQNADHAQQASQLANTAAQVASQGGEVVAEVVHTMQGINESSRRIADIIGVIDGIAFQTNILALNAAVEAARAGEQGRGFAVVAGEVRLLAARSAEAAREIKSLITASVERVEAGTQQADRAGGTMNEVVGSIRRVSGIVSEISGATREQSAGVSQVGEAVTQMDQATQQNAALVEETAAAAAALHAQAQQLVTAVARFRIDGGPRVQAAALLA